jgi:hypothetical protein
VPVDWHPHQLRDLPPESDPDKEAEMARRVDERMQAVIGGAGTAEG